MYFTKLRSMELKHSALNHFCIQSYGNNLIIENPVTEAIVLQLNNEPDVAELFPYSIASVDIPQEQPITKLLRAVDMREIYDNSLVQEQQEFGLDPIYISECSIEPAKPRLQQAQLSPATAEKPMLAIISTYGACHILMKNPFERLWQENVGNLNKLLMSEVFPINESPCDLKTFATLKAFVNLYVITACSWHSSGSIIYIANAAGYIIAFKVNFDLTVEAANEKATWSFLSKISADIGRISFLKAFDDYLLAVSNDGVIRLFKLTSQESTKVAAKFESLEILWNQKDQMSCRQILVQKCKSDNSYLILYTKAAHVICMRITSAGKVEGHSSLYVPGIKITGLELFHENEVIVTTITGHILRVTFACIRKKDAAISLRLKADHVSTPNLDAENIQILGVGSTINKALWVFMTHRNKEMPVSSKQSVLPSHLIICKPNTVDALEQLNNIPFDTNEPYQDLILALRMDVWHSNLTEKYEIFSIFKQNRVQQTFDDTFLRKIQIQLEIARTAFRRSSYKLQIVDQAISKEIEFLELAAQITHIMLRLEYLQSLIDNERIVNATAGFNILSVFQQRTVYTMRKTFYILIEKLKSSTDARAQKDEFNKLEEIKIEFIELAFRNLRNKCQDFEIIDNALMEEKCLLCQERLNEQELMCQFGHNLRRCCVSFLQLPWFNNRFCLQCGTIAMDNHNNLAELFPQSESVKCTFCRSIFINKETI